MRAKAGNAFVYVMRRQDGLRKLGFSSNPAGRKSGLNSRTGVPLAIERTWEMNKSMAIYTESVSHSRLDDCRVYDIGCGREVYAASLDQLSSVIDDAISEIVFRSEKVIVERKNYFEQIDETTKCFKPDAFYISPEQLAVENENFLRQWHESLGKFREWSDGRCCYQTGFTICGDSALPDSSYCQHHIESLS
jgi:hypothetical protein